MSTLFTELSKEVGWDKRNIKYPSVREVRLAIERHNHNDLFNLLMWHRNLASPETAKQIKVINLIDDGLANMKV
jgi:hypothetical protein